MVDILMLCVGSRGDVQPFACLAKELMKQQLTVVVAAHGEYKKFVESFGCRFAEIRSSLPKALHTSEAGQKLRDGDSKAAFTTGLDFFRPLIKVGAITTSSQNIVVKRGLCHNSSHCRVWACFPLTKSGAQCSNFPAGVTLMFSMHGSSRIEWRSAEQSSIPTCNLLSLLTQKF